MVDRIELNVGTGPKDGHYNMSFEETGSLAGHPDTEKMSVI